MSESFQSHMTFLDALKLKVGDKIDHRDLYGHYALATIVDKVNDRSGMLKLHYDGLPNHYDTECSYINELERFAAPCSISRRPAHRLKSIKVGSFVDISELVVGIKQHQKGWRRAEVVAKSHRSGQVQVQYLLDMSGGVSKPMKWKKWVHLDNCTEVAAFGTHTSRQDINHLRVSLETKRAYSNIPCHIKQKCAHKIIESVYAGMSNVVSHLMSKASTCQLQQMYEIIKLVEAEHIDNIEQVHPSSSCSFDTNLSCGDSLSCTTSPSPPPSSLSSSSSCYSSPLSTTITTSLCTSTSTNTRTSTSTSSSLTSLSSDSISTICGFLDREDIKHFKLTCYCVGIVCLTEMTKCNVAISNINEIINDVEHKHVDELGAIYRKNYRYERYPANLDYLCLRKIWQQRFNIPLSQQLLVSQNERACRFYDTRKNEKMSKFKIRVIPTPKFLLFDKRNLIKFDECTQQPRVMDICNEKKQCISFIKWFDIYFQTISPLQWVMGNRDTMTIAKLTHYIEYEFIATTDEQKQWHTTVLGYFKRMDKVAPNISKLMVHREYKNQVSPFANPDEKISWWTVCIFQLNTNHPAFDKFKFTTLQEKYSLLQQ